VRVLHFAGDTPGTTGIADKKGKDSRSLHRAGKPDSSEIFEHHLLQLDPDALVVGRRPVRGSPIHGALSRSTRHAPSFTKS
jgi:hypothetical protein